MPSELAPWITPAIFILGVLCLDRSIRNLREELGKEIRGLREEVRKEMRELRGELRDIFVRNGRGTAA